jgi:hypothetical protein
MPFEPRVNQELVIDAVTYRVPRMVAAAGSSLVDGGRIGYTCG